MSPNRQIFTLMLDWERVKNYPKDELLPFDLWALGKDDNDKYNLWMQEQYPEDRAFRDIWGFRETFDIAPPQIKSHFLYRAHAARANDIPPEIRAVINTDFHFRAWQEDFAKTALYYLYWVLPENEKDALKRIVTVTDPTPDESVYNAQKAMGISYNHILPPHIVQTVYKAFQELNRENLKKLLQHFMWQGFLTEESCHTHYDVNSNLEWDILPKEANEYKRILREVLDGTRTLFNALYESPFFDIDEEPEEYQEFYTIKSIEAFMVYYDYYRELFEVATQKGAALHIQSWY